MKSRQDILHVFKHLDAMRSHLSIISTIYTWEKRLKNFLILASIYHVLYSAIYSFCIVYYKYSKEEFAVVYWLEKSIDYQNILCAFSFFVVFTKKTIILGYFDVLNLLYSLVCFVIYQTCKEHLKTLNNQDGKGLETMYKM
ncbi:unnamed protein product, partial [Larinioides sclopetarius]